MTKKQEIIIGYVKSGHHEKIADSTAGYVEKDETVYQLARSGKTYVTYTVSGGDAHVERVMTGINRRLRGRYDIAGRSASDKIPLKTG
jgi:MoaA/NifB/PqqE/SkfB family radical SAM enzyme